MTAGSNGTIRGAHVVLLDLHLPGLEGAAGVRYVRSRGPRVLVVSASSTSQEVVDALIAGAGGYLLKTVEGPDLLQALKVVAAGATYVTPTLAGCLLTASHAIPTLEFTDRERDVLILLAQGERDLDIAEELGISVRTVHTYLVDCQIIWHLSSTLNGTVVERTYASGIGVVNRLRRSQPQGFSASR